MQPTSTVSWDQQVSFVDGGWKEVSKNDNVGTYSARFQNKALWSWFTRSKQNGGIKDLLDLWKESNYVSEEGGFGGSWNNPFLKDCIKHWSFIYDSQTFGRQVHSIYASDKFG